LSFVARWTAMILVLPLFQPIASGMIITARLPVLS